MKTVRDLQSVVRSVRETCLALLSDLTKIQTRNKIDHDVAYCKHLSTRVLHYVILIFLAYDKALYFSFFFFLELKTEFGV